MYKYQLGLSVSTGIFALINNHTYFVPVMKYMFFCWQKFTIEIKELGFALSKNTFIIIIIFFRIFYVLAVFQVASFANHTKHTCSELPGNLASL